MKNLTIAMAHGDDLAQQCVLLSAMSVADSDECDRLYSFSLRGKVPVKPVTGCKECTWIAPCALAKCVTVTPVAKCVGA